MDADEFHGLRPHFKRGFNTVGIAEFQHEMACKIETAEAGVLGPQGTEKHAAVLRELISR